MCNFDWEGNSGGLYPEMCREEYVDPSPESESLRRRRLDRYLSGGGGDYDYRAELPDAWEIPEAANEAIGLYMSALFNNGGYDGMPEDVLATFGAPRCGGTTMLMSFCTYCSGSTLLDD